MLIFVLAILDFITYSGVVKVIEDFWRLWEMLEWIGKNF